MQEQIAKIITNALQEAEMRQGCTDYTPYVESLYTQILSSIAATPDEALLLSDEEISHAIINTPDNGLKPTDNFTLKDRANINNLIGYISQSVAKAQLSKCKTSYEARLAIARDNCPHCDTPLIREVDIEQAKQEVLEKIKNISIPDLESGDDFRYYRDYILGELSR